jgi:hypothetical protein
MASQQAIKNIQEALLWHQLNNQLHEMKAQGMSISDMQYESLKKFCFDNNLFSKIKQPQYIQDIPLVLCSNLTDTFFFTIGTPSWINKITKLMLNVIPDITTLNIDQALADAYVVLREYDRKYNLAETTDISSDDDEELFEFINTYNKSMQENRYNSSEVANSLFEAKGKFLEYFLNNDDYKTLLKVEGTKVVIDLDSPNNEITEAIGIQYRQIFYEKANNIISKVKHVIDGDNLALVMLLLEDKAEGSKNEAIKEFFKYETELIKEEEKLINSLYDNYTKSKTYMPIPIIDISPFSFLEYPFPEI